MALIIYTVGGGLRTPLFRVLFLTVLVPESFRGGCSFGATDVALPSSPDYCFRGASVNWYRRFGVYFVSVVSIRAIRA